RGGRGLCALRHRSTRRSDNHSTTTATTAALAWKVHSCSCTFSGRTHAASVAEADITGVGRAPGKGSASARKARERTGKGGRGIWRPAVSGTGGIQDDRVPG